MGLGQPTSGTDWTNRRVLVTGADGFVGRWLVPALAARGAAVQALVWSGQSPDPSLQELFPPGKITLVSGDITDLAAMTALITAARIDTVYHLAANNINTGTEVSPYAVFETNIRGVYTVLEACRAAAHPVAAVVASSREVEDCFQPAPDRKHHPYMTSKAAAELVTRAYGDTFGLPVVRVRSDNLYGGGDFNWSRLVPHTVRSVLRGERPVIRSRGQLRRDYVYVEDAVAAYLAIGERLAHPEVAGQLFHVATGNSISVLAMVAAIARAAGVPELEPCILGENREERVDAPYTPAREQAVLGWQSQFTREAGLARTIQWYRDFFRRKAGNGQPLEEGA